MIGLQALEAAFNDGQRLVAVALGDLGGEEDLLAARLHDLAHARFALPGAIGVRRIDIADAQVDRAVHRLDRFVFVAVSQKAAARAHGEDRHFGSGPSQRAGGQSQLASVGAGNRLGGQAADGSVLEKTSA